MAFRTGQYIIRTPAAIIDSMIHNAPGRVGIVVIAAAVAAALAASGAPTGAQGFVTPTPGPDGKIIYVVQDGDALWTIAALSGKSVEELMALNGIQSGDFLRPGMELLLGIAGPAQPTAAPQAQPTDTPRPLTPTPVFGTGEICVMLFLDVNGDARLTEGEPPLSGGQISIADPTGVLAGEHTTDAAAEGYCFVQLENGDYNVSAAAPEGHNPTTTMNVPVRLDPGEVKHIEFGAQASAALGGSGGSASRSGALGVVGVVLLLAAVGLGVVASRYTRRSTMKLR